ncbi:MAG: hypothetical protein RLZ15_979, partial [Actinomycetota bacterium]
IGTAACPPYHLAIVVGGTSAEHTVKTAKLASTKYLDNLPTTGDAATGHAFRDPEVEAEVLKITQALGIGAQFGGKYFCHDVRVIRLPRHGASLPIAIAVSCSADRQAKAKITKDGIFIEDLEREPAHFLPETTDEHLDDNVVKIDLSKPMSEIRAELSKYPVKTRLSLTGTLVVARDLAHAKIKALIDSGKPMPEYMQKYAVSNWFCIWIFWSNYCRSHGFICRTIPSSGRFICDACKGKSLKAGNRCLQEKWRLLPWINWRTCSAFSSRLHKEGRSSGF